MKKPGYDKILQQDPGPLYERGVKQPNACRDSLFAVLFIIQLIVVLGISHLAYYQLAGTELGAGEGGSDNRQPFDSRTAVCFATICAAVAAAVSLFFMALVVSYAEQLVTCGLIFGCAVSFTFVLGMLISGSLFLLLIGMTLLAINIWYIKCVWNRIPFAAANLAIATTAVKQNSGLFVVAYSVLPLGVIWTVCWGLTFAFVAYNESNICEHIDEYGKCQDEQINNIILFLLLVSYYWTHQVFSNTIHVTVAGTVGSWWHDPINASSCCSNAVRDSYLRATTYSFGSICFGSLITAIICAMKELANKARRQNDRNNGALLCMIECILTCVRDIAEYFNKWAYVYVGLYGYPYLEAGKNVINLFRCRGWTTIITDDLVRNTLFFINFGAGLLTGIVSLFIGGSSEIFGGVGVAFAIAFLIGIFVSCIVMKTIESSVNTIIVCYAECPAEFQLNHPDLSNKIRAAWLEAYPSEFHS